MLQTIFKQGHSSRHGRGQLIDVHNSVHFIQSGTVAAYSTEAGNKRLILMFKEGEFFPCFQDDDGRYEYRVIKRVELISVSQAKFDAMTSEGEGSAEVVRQLTHIVGLQMERIQNIQRGSVMDRLIHRLQFIIPRLGVERSGRVLIDVPLSHADLASSIGTSRETVNRYMKQLEKRGIITINKNSLVINSVNDLERMSGKGSKKSSKGPIAASMLAVAFIGILSSD